MAIPDEKVFKKLSSTQSLSRAENLDVFCQPCDRADERLPVVGYCVDCEEYLCELCFKTHTRPKPVQHHQLLDDEHMPLAKGFQKAQESALSRRDCDLTMPCPQHTEELVKFYCLDHNALICSVCVADVHTSTSCHTHYIPDISEQTLDSTEFNKALNDLDKISAKYQRIKKDLKQRIDQSTFSLTYALEELENFRKEFNKGLDVLTGEIHHISTITQEDNNVLLRTTEKSCNNIIKSLQKFANNLKDFNKDRKADQLFAELKIAQQLFLDNIKKMLNSSADKDIDNYIFEPNQEMKKLLQSEKLGEVNSKKQINQTRTEMKMSTPKFINVKTESDKTDCQIDGIALSQKNQAYIADHNNKAIKMIDAERGVIDKLQLESEPWDVTIVTNDKLAVTLPYSETILLIFISSRSLSMESQLKVNSMCCGISHHEEKLAVTFPVDSKLIIMDLNGTVQVEVEKDSSGDEIFSHPEYVATNSQSIYVSDRDKSAVIWLNWKGDVMGQYDRLKCPRGIQMFDDNSFLVNDKNNDCVIHSDGDYTNSKIVLSDIYKPHALDWCPETSTLCISRHNPFKVEGDNHIVLYQIN